VETWQVEGMGQIVDVNPYNNGSQENIFKMQVSGLSPWQDVPFTMKVTNPYFGEVPIKIDTEGLLAGYQVELDNPQQTLAAQATEIFTGTLHWDSDVIPFPTTQDPNDPFWQACNEAALAPLPVTAPQCGGTWSIVAKAFLGDTFVPIGGVSFPTVGKPVTTLTSSVTADPSGDYVISGTIDPPAASSTEWPSHENNSDQHVRIVIVYPSGHHHIVTRPTNDDGSFDYTFVPTEPGTFSVCVEVPYGEAFKSTKCEPIVVGNYERWDNVGGSSVSQIPLNEDPDFISTLELMEVPSNVGNNYGARVTGLIRPPTTGNYRFFIEGDDNVALFLSPDASPLTKTKIAYHTGYTNVHEWTKFASQKSNLIALQAGQLYYIEAQLKESSGADHMAVGWLKPGQSGNEPTEIVPIDRPAPPLPKGGGSILFEKWTGINGTAVASIPVQNPPNYTQEVTQFEGLTNVQDNYGARIRGWLTAPVSGSYTFWISGDDHVALYFSQQGGPESKQQIAYHNSYSGQYEWNKFATQKSAAIALVAGKRYYIEALMKEQSGSDHFAVGWLMPGQSGNVPSEIIPGRQLWPFDTCFTPCDACATCEGGTCVPRAAGSECRPTAGVCDVAETCDGSSTLCPADAVANSGTVCRGASGPCDVVETCSGSSVLCPTNVLANSGTVCRPSAGVCDTAETCSGSSSSCPGDMVAPAGASCRASVGACDAAETCNGSASTCPSDGFATSGTVCRASVGLCDAQETCSGSSDTCPADALSASGTVCRTAAGTCDAAETCSGSSIACPADVLQPSGTLCRDAVAGGCDLAETCSGASSGCPTDVFAAAGAACTDDGNSCTQDLCSGTSGACPRTLLPSCAPCGNSALTRSAAVASSSINGNVAANAIDGTPGNTGSSRWESTQGVDPQWIYVDLGATHHISSVKINWENASAKNYVLQVAPSGTCSGGGAGCLGTDAPWTTIFTSPTHTVSNRTDDVSLSGVGRYVRMKGSTRMTQWGYSIEDFAIYGDTNTVCGTTCSPDCGPCATCQSSVCVAKAAGTTCRAAVAGGCDVAETCNGTAQTCPSDAVVASGTVCRQAVAGGCDVAETCSGSTNACPTDAIATSGTVCRAAVSGGCDIAETCNGTTTACPADAVAQSGAACTDDGNSCTQDFCNGTSGVCPYTLLSTCAPCGNSALTRSAAVASSAISGNVAGNAIDGTPGNTGSSRWESTHAVDPQWIYVDLGATHHISSVKINWENASAKNYVLQVAPSGTCSGGGAGCLGTDTPWTTIFTSPTHTVSNRTDDVSVSGVGRYVRMKGSTRMTQYGYSIEDFAIYGDANAVCGTQ
jgi:hypothetical protein